MQKLQGLHPAPDSSSRKEARQAGEVYLRLQEDAEMITTININSKGMEKGKFGIRDKHCWIDFPY